MSPDIVFGAGDTAPIVTDTLYGSEADDDGNPVPLDLTGATVVMRYRLKDQTEDEVRETVDIDADPTTGAVEWTPATARAAGDYNANWVVTLDTGEIITVPNDRYLWLRVLPAP